MYNLRAGSLFKPPCVTTAMAKDYHVSGAGSKSSPSRARARLSPVNRDNPRLSRDVRVITGMTGDDLETAGYRWYSPLALGSSRC